MKIKYTYDITAYDGDKPMETIKGLNTAQCEALTTLLQRLDIPHTIRQSVKAEGKRTRMVANALIPKEVELARLQRAGLEGRKIGRGQPFIPFVED